MKKTNKLELKKIIDMDIKTFFIYLAMYAYGFSLMTWAIFFDKRPTKKSKNAAKIGLGCLILTLFYFGYILITQGIDFS